MSDITKRNRRRRGLLYWAQSGLCPLCKQSLPMPDEAVQYQPRRLSLDHVYPKKYGGLDQGWNLLLTHEGCNTKKKSILPSIRLMLLAGLVHYAIFIREKRIFH